MSNVPVHSAVPKICKICCRVIHIEDETIHQDCYSTFKKQAAEMSAEIRNEVNKILKNAFVAVDNLLNKFTESLQWNTSVFESDVSESASDSPKTNKRRKSQGTVNGKKSRKVRTTTIQQRTLAVQTKRQTQKSTTTTIAQPQTTKPANKTISQKSSANVVAVSSSPTTNESHSTSIVSASSNTTTYTSTASLTTPISYPGVVGITPQLTLLQPQISQNLPSQEVIPVTNTTFASVVSQVPVTLYQNSDTQINEDVINIAAVPPPRSIFVTRIALDVDEKLLYTYIKSKISGLEQSTLTVRKMKFKETREFNAFELKVGRNEDLFNTLLCRNFWPQNAVVKEYSSFRKRNVHHNNN